MSTVKFRDFEERDIDFIYKCKNDKKLNSLIVGEFKPFSYEDAVKWVHGCMGEHETYKFWAICTNDDERRIIGWLSLSQIDKVNKKACFHGIVIGDKDYKDGIAWIDSFLFVYSYVFECLEFNRLYGSCLTSNKASLFITEAMCESFEGIERQAICKDGMYYDVIHASILRNEYLECKKNNEFELNRILSRLKISRQKNKNIYLGSKNIIN